ncbi:MAG: KilA-N domain-containing protein [Verrucomicrobiae bacterium]|nr:KilA-N domain-containing protein [Verrucomicrobiae bacterium]
MNAHQIDRPALILRRTVDGYIDATSTCRAVGKKFGHYLANQAT